MRFSATNLCFLIALSLGGGVAGAWFFATWESLSRAARDAASMAALAMGLVIAGVFLALALAKAGGGKPPSKQKTDGARTGATPNATHTHEDH
ncbi:MAG: hypothetical protein ACE5GQ_07555 [Nitrospinales bacterium]